LGVESFTVRPRSLLVRTGWALAGLAMIAAGVLAIGWLSDGSLGETAFGVGFVLFGLGCLWYLRRVRVAVDERGVVVRNALSTYEVPWSQLEHVEVDTVETSEAGVAFHRLTLVTPDRRIKAAGTAGSRRACESTQSRLLASRDEARGFGAPDDAVLATGGRPTAEAAWQPVWRRVPGGTRRTLVVAATAAAVVVGVLAMIFDWTG
jgi:hypothetical protein